MKFTENFLNVYRDRSYILQQKSKFLLYVHSAVITAGLCILGYTTFLHLNNPLVGNSVDPGIFGVTSGTIILVLVCTILLTRGHFTLSAHLTIIGLFIAIWAGMIMDRTEAMTRLDTAMLLMAVLSSSPLLVTRRSRVILFYSMFNLAAFCAYMFYYRPELGLSTTVFYSHLADNTIAFLFIGYIAYNIFTINSRAMEKIDENRGRLEMTCMELQATTEELKSKNEDLIRSEKEREHTRMLLVQAQKMEAVGTLAGGIAHDFNNMLGGIMGSISMMEMLIRKDHHPMKDNILGYVETAREASRRATDMTRQLLTLSRKSEPELVPVDIAASIKHIGKLCATIFPKSVALNFTFGEEPLRVYADPVQIEQVLLNLCINAMHAMTIMRPGDAPRGGTIVLRAESIRCDGHTCPSHPVMIPGDVFIRISVTDSGVGMDEETRHHIFNPFYTTKKSGEGTGLGLAITYSIVQQHGGFIDVVSEPGKGSTFTVCLPALTSEVMHERKKTKSAGIVPGSGRVLVIDDEAAMLHVAEGMLEYSATA